MCKQSPIQDQEIKDLCKTIIASQQAEIDQMKAMLVKKIGTITASPLHKKRQGFFCTTGSGAMAGSRVRAPRG